MSTSPRKRLPVQPSIEHLKKQAKRRAKSDSIALAEAQHRLAGEYGCRNWAELLHVVETMRRGSDQLSNVKATIEPLPAAVRTRDVPAVRRILESGEFTPHDLDKGLAHAAWYGGDAPDVLAARKTLFDLLLDAGADPDGQYGSAYGPIVFGTGECQSPEGLQWLIDAGADVAFARVETKYGHVCPMDTWLGGYGRGHNAQKHAGIELLLRHNAFVPPEVSPPILAIHRGDAAELGRLIDADRTLLRRTFADMPYGNIELRGATLLHCAVEFGEIDCIEAILARYRGWGDLDLNSKADVIDGVGGQTPIYHAIHSSAHANFYTLEHLVRHHGRRIDMGVRATWRGTAGWAIRDFDPTRTPLTPMEYAQIAARDIDPKHAHFYPKLQETIDLLRPLDRRATIRQAAERGDIETFPQMLDDHPDLLTGELWPPAIHKAKSVELVRLLLDRGLDPNDCPAPRKPLHLAAYYCLADIIELLIAHGADVNYLNTLEERPLDLIGEYELQLHHTEQGRRSREALLRAGARHNLQTAIRAGDLAETRRLLDADPSLLHLKEPWTGLFTAARTGQVETAKLLIERDAAVDAVATNGRTALWLACESADDSTGRIAVAKLLLEHGANPRRTGDDGSTPLHIAAYRGPIEMVELLLRHDAKEWMTDKDGKLPRDYARGGVAPDREAMVDLLTRPVIRDPHFKSAVAAIHAGDATALAALLQQHPNLIHDRATEPDCYRPGYFRDPKLLWFVANNPNLIDTMPPNIVKLTEILLAAGPDVADINYTLELVMTSDPAAKQGHQRPLMRTLLAHGGSVQPRAIETALAHSDTAPVHFLLELGHPLTAPLAAGLGKVDDLLRLLPTATRAEIQSALSLAVINGHLDAARACLAAGADVNAFSVVHVHATSAHQAAIRDDVPLLKLLVDHGANLTTRDKLWNGTPLGWALHEGKTEAAEYLRSLNAPQ